jgi:hypothetical protein
MLNKSLCVQTLSWQAGDRCIEFARLPPSVQAYIFAPVSARIPGASISFGFADGYASDLQPLRHVTADWRGWQRQRAEQLDHLAGYPSPLVCSAADISKSPARSFALTVACKRGELTPDATEHVARRLRRDSTFGPLTNHCIGWG